MDETAFVAFHRPARRGDPPLTACLADARSRVLDRQVAMFRAAGVGRVLVVEPVDTPPDTAEAPAGAAAGGQGTFGDALAALVRDERVRRAVVLGSGAVPRLRSADVRLLLDAASSPGRVALTNNRYSSDVCAVSDAVALADLPPLPGDNALPRWLEEAAGFAVRELPGRSRLALDLDSPLDVALLGLSRDAPAWSRGRGGGRAAPCPDATTRDDRAASPPVVPRLDELRAVAAHPRRELLVFGRSSAWTMAWLERNTRCRVRFLAEERGLRGASPLAFGGRAERPVGMEAMGRSAAPLDDGTARRGESALPYRPRATLGRLLDRTGPDDLARLVGELADAAILDSRVLLADRFGSEEAVWPPPEDRFASDLLLADTIGDGWLRALTASAAGSAAPILLGGHTLVGPGIPLLLGRARR